MQQLSGMHIFDGSQQLVDDVLLVNFFEDFCTNDRVEICLHVVEDEVDVFVVVGLQDVHQLDDILMAIQLLQKHDFSESSLSICSILEGIEDLLQRHCGIRASVCALPHDAVRAFAKFLKNIVFAQHVLIYVFRHGGERRKLG